MPPDDPTPLGDAMTHRFPDQKIPEPEPEAERRVRERPSASHHDAGNAADTAATDIANRPPLPDHPQRMAADIEDEDADPVTDTGPGIADGVKPPSKQRG